MSRPVSGRRSQNGFPRSCILSLGATTLALCLGFGPQAVHASTAIVPDDFTTVQGAVDSGVDTVLVREGSYPERPVVNRRMALIGISDGKRPRLDGLDLNNGYDDYASIQVSVSRIDFTERVEQTMMSYRPRNQEFHFSECSLGDGFFQVLSTDPDDVSRLTFLNCRMGGHSVARAYRVVMESDTISGGVSWELHEASIVRCWFMGGPNGAIELTDIPRAGSITQNRIENYEVGIYLDSAESYTVEDNTISACGTGISVNHVSGVTVRRNGIQRCGVGIDVVSGENQSIEGNTILHSSEAGIRSNAAFELRIEGNVVGVSDGPGIFIESGDTRILRKNTVFGNGGCGIEIFRPFEGVTVAENNVVASNREWGIKLPLGDPVDFHCNDWFGNGFGPVEGAVADPTDLSVDPMFCNVDSADVRLSSTSPLADAPGCGQIGALGVGCGVTATLLEMFTVQVGSGGAMMRWSFGADAPAVQWVERALDEAGPWRRLIGRPEVDGEGFAQYDGDVRPGASYWYRVAWGGGGEGGHSAAIRFGLEGASAGLRISPSPSRGPVSIEWSLAAAADVDLRVFDLAGREVATAAKRRFEAGAHAVRWDGRASGGAAAPAGWYVARMRHGGAAVSRMILLVR